MRPPGAVFATALVAGLFALIPPLAAWGQVAPSLSPELADRVDQIAREQVHDGRTPGLAIGIVQDGRLVYARGFGFATTGPRHSSMTPGTEFYVGGLTKEFTAAAILLLVQDGKLKLDDPVSKYVPEFKLAANVTVAQLLTQTSGLPNSTAAPGLSTDPTRSVKLADVFAAVDKLKPLAPPGSAYAENPLNYLLAGVIVERASGVPLSDYLEQHIFIPLVMNHTFLAGDNGISPSHATGYTRANNSFRTASTWDPAWLAGDAGLVTTIDDLAKWDVEMPVLLRVDAVRTIFTPSGSEGATHYGMGWVVDRRGGKDFVWSNGEISGYRAMNALLPDDHVAVIVFSNADSLHGGTTTPETVGGRVLDVLVPPASAQLDNAVVTRAKEWLGRLASREVDRSELTPAFSSYLTDALVAHENFASLGQLQTIVPLSSRALSGGDILYEFLVGYPHASYHYKFQVAPDGKIDGIMLVA
jgi:D-alanyl-D-alanine carboxypeptidase